MPYDLLGVLRYMGLDILTPDLYNLFVDSLKICFYVFSLFNMSASKKTKSKACRSHLI